MQEAALDLLVISDLHYHMGIPKGDVPRAIQTSLGVLLVEKALLRLRQLGIEPDLIVLPGDLTHSSTPEEAETDLRTVHTALHSLSVPFLAIPGNHDGAREIFPKVFDCAPGLHSLNGYGFLLFHDEVGEGDRTTRLEKDLRLPMEVRQQHPELVLVAIQHNPLHPAITHDYPYVLSNADDVLRTYRKADVILSLSGHYHAGQPAHPADGTVCHTVAAACTSPFRFSHVQLRGRSVEVREHALRMETPSLMDVHCHTQFAYCGTTIAAPRSIELTHLMGLGGIGLVEHTFQLYLDPDKAWSFKWFQDPAYFQESWQTGRGRMPEYRHFIESLRRDIRSFGKDMTVRFGLEVDFCADGSISLAEEDREGWDYLIGAIHVLDGYERGKTSLARTEEVFMAHTEQLLRNPIHILAHPFRWFQMEKLPAPTHLYKTVAGWLAERGIAAELNLHTYPSDPLFYRECIARGVRIALATDSHAIAEVGDLQPHLSCLRQAGVEDSQLPAILYQPPDRSGR
jgi:histidinol phosphatase-like PHP family hydrolase/predicted phosphohydrolase